jgi:hypothetical protein
MNDSQKRKFDKLEREDVFATDNTADFPAGSDVALITAEIKVEMTSVLAMDAQQTSGFDSQRQAQEIYDGYRDEMIDLFDKIALAAEIVDDDIPGTAKKYPKAYSRSRQNLIAKATSYFDDSADIKQQLDDAGFTTDDRDRLPVVRDLFSQAAVPRDSSEEKHAEATGGMAASFTKMMDLSRRRDKRVRMKYRKNPAKLAGWTVASHLDRAPHHAKTEEKKVEEVKKDTGDK